MEVEKHTRVAWVWPQCQKETNYCKEVRGSFLVPSGFFLKPALRLKHHLPNLVREGGRVGVIFEAICSKYRDICPVGKKVNL